MTKYFSIFATSLKQERKTAVDALLSAGSFFVIIFIFSQLWGYIYGEGGTGELISGYTLKMMLWYMIGAEVITYALNPRGVTRAFSADIKSGKIAYQLNKPYNYFAYQVATISASFIWKLCFLVPSGIMAGLLMVGTIVGFSIAYVVPIIVCIVLSSILSCVLYGIIGMLCFWIEESTPFTWVVQKTIMLFGLFFPPELFPRWMQPIINYSPIFAIISGPSKLIASFSWELFAQTVITQLVYIGVFAVIGSMVYKNGTKKVNINGG